MKSILIAAGLPAAVAIPFAAPAHADAQGFFDYMRSHGYTNPVGMNGINDLSQAQQECSALRAGKPES